MKRYLRESVENEIKTILKELVYNWEDNARESGNENPSMTWVKEFAKKGKEWLLNKEKEVPGFIHDMYLYFKDWNNFEGDEDDIAEAEQELNAFTPDWEGSDEEDWEEEFDESFRNGVKTIREDFEFYKTPSGKIGVDKVITTTSKSGKTFKDGSDNKGDTSKAVKRIPLSKMTDEDKELAKAAYAALKKDGSIKNVDKKFKTDPKPDVVIKGDGTHADIYYDDNTDGEPDEKGVKLAASRKRTVYQRLHGLKEDTRGMVDGIDLDKVASNIGEVYDLVEGNIPENTLVAECIDYIFNDFIENEWYDDYGNVVASPRVVDTIKLLKKALLDKGSKDYFNFGDLYDHVYDLLFVI